MYKSNNNFKNCLLGPGYHFSTLMDSIYVMSREYQLIVGTKCDVIEKKFSTNVDPCEPTWSAHTIRDTNYIDTSTQRYPLIPTAKLSFCKILSNVPINWLTLIQRYSIIPKTKLSFCENTTQWTTINFNSKIPSHTHSQHLLLQNTIQNIHNDPFQLTDIQSYDNKTFHLGKVQSKVPINWSTSTQRHPSHQQQNSSFANYGWHVCPCNTRQQQVIQIF